MVKLNLPPGRTKAAAAAEQAASEVTAFAPSPRSCGERAASTCQHTPSGEGWLPNSPTPLPFFFAELLSSPLPVARGEGTSTRTAFAAPFTRHKSFRTDSAEC